MGFQVYLYSANCNLTGFGRFLLRDIYILHIFFACSWIWFFVCLCFMSTLPLSKATKQTKPEQNKIKNPKHVKTQVLGFCQAFQSLCSEIDSILHGDLGCVEFINPLLFFLKLFSFVA